MNGYLLIDKESGITSFDVVRMVRKAFNVKKVGHCGTLDPLATGLLLVFVGEGTKLLEYFVGLDKEYTVMGKFGYVSDSFDADGEVVEVMKASGPFSKSGVDLFIRNSFVGDISQVPPVFSALKVDGKRAYELARAGEVVEMKSRGVVVHSFDVLGVNWPYVSFSVKCGSGTYVRSLIHDLGQKIGCGAYVTELRRTMVGDFSVDDAVSSAELSKKVVQLNPLESLVDLFTSFQLVEGEYKILANGGFLMDRSVDGDAPVLALFNGKVVGVLENLKDKVGIKFAKKFN